MTKPSCHPEKDHYAKGLCVNCYVNFRYHERRKLAGKPKRSVGYIDKNGYQFFMSDGIRKSLHKTLAEKAFDGPLPAKAVIHHHGPKKDNKLVICEDQAYHMLLERRTRAFYSYGNPSWVKCNSCGIYGDPSKMLMSWRQDRRSAVYFHRRHNKKCLVS